MLQVAGRMSTVKHKALLMAPTSPTDGPAFKPVVSDEATNFPGDAFERMCMDPELIRTRRQFMIGAIGVAVIVVGAAVMHLTSAVEKPPAADLGQASASAIVDPAPAQTPPSRPVSSAVPPPVGTQYAAKPDAPMRINFRSATDASLKLAESPGDESQSALESFLKASTVDERLALAHDSVKVEAAMRAYYRNHEVGPLSYSHVEPHPQKVPGNFAEYRVVLKDGTRRFAAVMATPEGPRVDWASFVALGDLEWEQMRQTRPTKPVLMRVLASVGDRFSGSFSDSKTLSCVRFASAADPASAPVYGYVPNTSDLGRQIAMWLASGGSESIPLTVKLSYPSSATSNDQVWIAEVVVPGWVTVASARVSGE